MSDYFIVRVEVPNDDSLREYGIGQLAELALEDYGGANSTHRIELVEVNGYDQPTDCIRCGCDFHGLAPAPCPDPECQHPLCSPPAASPDPSAGG